MSSDTATVAALQTTKPLNELHEPYKIGKTIAKFSMKALAAKIASKSTVTSSASAPLQPKHSEINKKVGRGGNECDDGDIVFLESPPKKREAVVVSDDDNSPDDISSPPPASIKKRKKRLTKKEKAEIAAEMKREQEARTAELRKLATLEKARMALVNSNEAVEDIRVVDNQPSSDSSLPKAHIVILWGQTKNKFDLGPADSLQDVFDRMADQMNSTRDRIIIFHNSKPALRLNPLDRVKDIKNDERIFLAAFKDVTSSSSVRDVIPEQFRIHLVLQSNGGKARTKLPLDKRAPLKALMKEYADMMKKDLKNLRFSFDGDELKADQTAEQADLEGDEVIDVIERP